MYQFYLSALLFKDAYNIVQYVRNGISDTYSDKEKLGAAMIIYNYGSW